MVDVKLKEGSDRYHGGFSSQGGRFGTWYLSGQTSGPDWLTGGLRRLGLHVPGTASFLVDVSADFSDTYLPSMKDLSYAAHLRSGYTDSFLGHRFQWGDFWTPSEENTWRGLYKWTWKPDGKNKIDFGFSKRISFDQGFTRRPLGDLAGQSIPYPWLFENRFEHTQTVTSDVNSTQLTLTHTMNKNAYHSLMIARSFNVQEAAVDGKLWTEYEQPDDLALPPGQNREYFIDSGDADEWWNYWSQSITTDYKLGMNLGRLHKTEFGFMNTFQDVQYVDIIEPWVFDPDGLGKDHDLWHVYPDIGAFYAQDRLELEGFVAEAGTRVDYWFPGEQLEDAVADTNNTNVSDATREAFMEDTGSLFGHRVKAVFSPRVAVSHPIQNRDKLFFNFGQFTQFPSYIYVYSKMTSVSSASFPILGNANLNPEKSVQFEVGAQHLFDNNAAAKISLFQKDIYDYPTSVRFRRQEGTVISDFSVYLNSDFSRARGFELEYEKPRAKYFKWKATYEYSVAKGKSSDPNQAKIVEEGGGDATEPPLSEGFLSWNRPHKLTLNGDYRVARGQDKPKMFGLPIPNGFGVNLFGTIQSGKAYTPADVDGNATGRVYSKNGPIEAVFNLRLNQELKLGHDNTLNAYLIAENLLDWKVVKRVDPSTGKQPKEGEGQYVRPTQYEINSVLTNPAYVGPPLRIRIGVDYDF